MMKSKIVLWFALVLSCGLVGCSSTNHDAAGAKPSPPELYLHLFASFVYPETPRLILSAPIQLSSDFDIPMGGDQNLKGRVEPRNGKFHVQFSGRLCSGTNVFNDEVELEKRYEPGPQPYDDKAPFVCQPHFVLSSNASPKPFLKQQAAAEKKFWDLRNPLTARQVAGVKGKFHLMRPGLTRDELFAILDLSRYQNRLGPSSMIPMSRNLDIVDYQLAEGERLMLFFDHTGMTTRELRVPGLVPGLEGGVFQMWDYSRNTSNRLVLRAQLDTIIRPSNGPPVWHTTLQWP
jgi:hypothetical protein